MNCYLLRLIASDGYKNEHENVAEGVNTPFQVPHGCPQWAFSWEQGGSSSVLTVTHFPIDSQWEHCPPLGFSYCAPTPTNPFFGVCPLQDTELEK